MLNVTLLLEVISNTSFLQKKTVGLQTSIALFLVIVIFSLQQQRSLYLPITLFFCLILCKNNSFLFLPQVEIIGGADKYLAVCRSCFKSPLKSPRKHETPPFNSMKESKTMANRQLFNSPVKNC